MEDDDEFGELYADVIRPIAASAPPPLSPPRPSSSASSPRGRPDPPLLAAEDNFDGGDGLLFGASRSGPSAEPPSTANQALAPSAAAVVAEDDGGGDWMLGRAPPVADPPENWDDEDDAVSSRPAVVGALYVTAEDEPKVLEDDEGEARVSGIPDEDGVTGEAESSGAPEEGGYPLFGGGVGENLGDLDQAPLIPGLSAGPAPSGPSLSMNTEDGKPSQSEDWDSDSEDDLQIVLNDSNHGPLGAERNNVLGVEDDDDDDGEEDLVIVTDGDQHHHIPAMEEQAWGEEAMQPTGDGERKEMVDGAKVTGATGTAPGARIGYSNHGFHAQHHSMYKYIRPAAAPLPGDPAAATIGLPGSARPPIVSGPVAGQGRGDWRPASGRGIPSGPKGYHTGFGFPAWGSSSARAFGSGLDFALPAHKTVFDVDIESFEEKPWRHPGVDISDFFNFGLDEDKWKDYCKQLDQHRLESTMQSKIRVYEGSRSEQEYDPDLPPELAAAAGHDISANNGRGKADDGEINFTSQGRGLAVMRAPLPTGRAIQVESGGYGERLPSIDTRPPRIRESDVIIEIVLQDSFDDPKTYNCVPEQPDKDVEGDDDRSFRKVEKDDRNNVPGYVNRYEHTSSSQNKEMTRRVPFAKEKDGVLPLHSESSTEHHQNSRPKSPVSHDGAFGIHQGGRLPQGSSSRKSSSAHEQSTDSIPSRSAPSGRLGDQQKETMVDDTEVNQSPQKSPAVADDTARELSVEDRYCEHDEKLALVDSVEIEGEDMTSDFHMSIETGGDDNLVHPGKKQKLCSRVEQPAVHDIGYEDELRASNSDNSREKSGSSKDYPRQTENGDIIQEGHLSWTGCLKRPLKKDEHNVWRKDEYGLDTRQEMEKNRIVSKGREDMSNAYQNPLRGRSHERRKESESSTSSWQRREDNLHGRRAKDEEIRWENNDEMLSRHKSKLKAVDRNQKDEDQSRKHVEDGEWRSHNRDEVLRQRARDDILMGRRENMDDPPIKRKRDEEYLRGKADKVENLHVYRDREDSRRRKRERDDGLHHKRREADTSMRDRAEDHLSSKHKDDSWRHREREDRQRLKPHEIAVAHREREEGRGAGRSGRVIEDKPLGGTGRYRDELKATSYDKDHQEKERRRHSELSRKDRAREDNVSRSRGRGDVSVHEKHSNSDERSSRHERLNTHGDRPPGVDGQQMHRERHRGNTSKAKNIESHEQNNQVLGKRKHDDRRRTEKVYTKDSNKQESNNISSTTLSKDPHQIHVQREAHQQQNSMKKRGEDDPASDDESQGSKRGRSKLERWTSHKERDYDGISNTPTLSASSRGNKTEGNIVDVAQADDVAKVEVNNIAGGELDAKGVDYGQIVDKMVDDQDRHLDTVAKLKRRSERFKLPMPKEKEITLNKKLENEVQLSNNETGLDSEVKPERPARKRRWTGS